MASASSSSNPSATATRAAPFLYACIAHHDTILTEHIASAASNASNLASAVLPKIGHDNARVPRSTFTHQDYYIHYLSDADDNAAAPSSAARSGPYAATDALNGSGLTYLVIIRAINHTSSLPFGSAAIPFKFLADVKTRFLNEYNPAKTNFSSLPAYGAAAFNGPLRQLMLDYTAKATQPGQQGGDAFSSVQTEIDTVRGVMTQNIERVLERGERIDLLVDKTDTLGANARDFRVRSRGLRRRMWWKNVKLMVLLGVVIVFLMYLLVGMACGLPGWGKCVGGGKKKEE